MQERHEIELRGCNSRSLGGYLKALGVFRIISQQLDPSCRASWAYGFFRVNSICSEAEILRFFLEDYSPTPFLAPWNNGSGFYSMKGDGKNPIEKLETSTAKRFDGFRKGIRDAKDSLTRVLGTWQFDLEEGNPETKKAKRTKLKDSLKNLKTDLILECKRSWRGAHREWLDAAVVVSNEANPVFPPILGTGGNDAKLDFSANAMERVCEIFQTSDQKGAPSKFAESGLAVALKGDFRGSFKKTECKIGQFDPGAAGGANSTTNDTGKSSSDPWSLLLVLEGAILLSPRLLRRLNPGASARASSPFSVSSSQFGFGTAGVDKAERGEQWLPVWEGRAGLREVQHLFEESRMQIKGRPATNTLDALRAITSRGCARGVTEFVRIAYFERFGQQRLAIPLGRIEAKPKIQNHLLDDIAEWVHGLSREAEKSDAPKSFVSAQRNLANLVVGLLTHDETPARWQAVLIAAAQIEAVMAINICFEPGPIPKLRNTWLTRSNDGSPEWRLAASLGSSARFYKPIGDERFKAQDSVRHHFLPLDENAKSGFARFKTSDRKLIRSSPRLVAYGRDLNQDLRAILERRIIEARQAGHRRLPMVAAPGYAAKESDLVDLIEGRLDNRRIFWLARSLMALDWNDTFRLEKPNHTEQLPGIETRMPLAWWAIRLCLLPWPIQEELDIPAQLDALRRCATGHVSEASRIALRRLHIIGRPAGFSDAFLSRSSGAAWVGALGFPINKHSARKALERISRTSN